MVSLMLVSDLAVLVLQFKPVERVLTVALLCSNLLVEHVDECLAHIMCHANCLQTAILA